MQAIFSIFFLIFQSFLTVQLRAQQHAARGILPVNSNSLSTLLHTTVFSRAFPSLPYLLFLSSLYPKTGTSRIHPVRSTFFFSSSHLSQTSTSRILSSVSNTLWAPRVSFEIRHLRRLSRGSADPREHSRSWWLAQSYPAHVADGGKYPAGASPWDISFFIYLSR